MAASCFCRPAMKRAATARIRTRPFGNNIWPTCSKNQRTRENLDLAGLSSLLHGWPGNSRQGSGRLWACRTLFTNDSPLVRDVLIVRDNQLANSMALLKERAAGD